MNSMDGDQTFREEAGESSNRGRASFHRLNFVISSRYQGLDDPTVIESLQSQAMRYLQCGQDLTSAVDALYASMFYFELSKMPKRVQGAYVCEGLIYCRLDMPSEGRQSFYTQLRERRAYFLVNGQHHACVDSIPRSLPPYQKLIRFTIDELDDRLIITLGNAVDRARNISGLPTTIRELSELQVLDAPFGRVDHDTCERSLRKRKRADVEGPPMRRILGACDQRRAQRK